MSAKKSGSDLLADALGGNYPSTPHLSFSPGVNSDDTQLCSFETKEAVLNKMVVVTEKLDGGNCCLFGGKVYARTHKHEAKHESFDRVKMLYAGLCGGDTEETAHQLLSSSPLALFGENMSAQHSIEYPCMSQSFYLFAVFCTQRRIWLSWSGVETVAHSAGLYTVPVVARDVIFTSNPQLKRFLDTTAAMPSALNNFTKLPKEDMTMTVPEGFVIRDVNAFRSDEFKANIAKYVRANHVQTDDSWRRSWVKTTLVANDDEEEAKKYFAQNENRYKSLYASLSKDVQQQPSPPTKTRRAKTPPKPNTKAARLEAKRARSKSPGNKTRRGLHNDRDVKEMVKQRKTRANLAPKVLILAGLPGSGKSTFGDMMNRGGQWAWLSKDAMGSRRAVETQLGTILHGKKKHGQQTPSHAIVDMCNVTMSDRAAWIKFTMLPLKDIGIVYFATGVDECVRRAKLRAQTVDGHPTGDLFKWGGETIIRSHAAKLQVPIEDEAGRLYVVDALEDVKALAYRLGGDSSIVIPPPAESNPETKSEDALLNVAHVNACFPNSQINIEKVSQLLKVENKDLLCVYVYGSRLWNTWTPQSDYDLVVVCSDSVDHLKSGNTHIANVDFAIWKWSDYLVRLNEHRVIELLPYLIRQSFPAWTQDPEQSCIWLDRLEHKKFKFIPETCVSRCLASGQRDLAHAIKALKKGHVDKAFKTLCNAYRSCRIVGQLLRKQRVTNLSCVDANEIGSNTFLVKLQKICHARDDEKLLNVFHEFLQVCTKQFDEAIKQP